MKKSTQNSTARQGQPTRREYDEEFKQQALTMVRNGQSVRSVAEALGINENLIHQWKHATRANQSATELEEARRMVYGFIGVGAIAAAIVTGLCKDIEQAPAILLSPRNASITAELASRYSTVSIGADNQAVVDGASALILCLRPQDARDVLDNLIFSDNQVIISTMAGVSVEEIKLLVAPAREVSRAIPLPSVALRNGITPIHPPSEAAKVLFDRLGGTINLHDVNAFDALSASTATIAAHFAYLKTISQWLVSRNIPEQAARRYVTSTFASLATALGGGQDFERLARDHSTPGGINELFLTFLNERGVFENVGLGLQRVFDRLSVRSPEAPDQKLASK